MAIGFERTEQGHYAASFDEQERALLSHLARDLQQFLGPETAGIDVDPFAIGILESASISDDPALARLFPDAYELDEDSADDFRRYTENELRDAKAAHLAMLVSSLELAGDRTVLTADEARSWMIALNDLRLVIGTRLHLDDEEDVEPDIEPEYVEQLTAIYQWLTWLQESLVGAQLGDPQ